MRGHDLQQYDYVLVRGGSKRVILPVDNKTNFRYSDD